MPGDVRRKMKSHDIAGLIRRKIRNHRLEPGMPVMSTAQIARRYNVCLMTAHRVLDQLESEKLITRVKGSGSFVRRNTFHGRKLVFGLADENRIDYDLKRKTLMNVFPETALNWFKKQNCDYRVIPYMAFRDRDMETFAELDGLLLSPIYLDPETTELIRSLPIPVVIYRSEFEIDLPFPQVVPDHTTAINRMFQYATPENCGGIVIVYQSHPNGIARRDSFIKGAEKTGFSKDAILTLDIPVSEAYRTGLRLAGEIRGKLLLSCSDLVTYDIVSALAEKELVCGLDYQIVGFDNLEGVLKLPPEYPGITSIDYSRKTAAQTAANLLISTVIQKNSFCYQIIKLPTRLTVRESAFSHQQGFR